MTEERNAVRNKIMFAAIECIEKEGLQTVTTRSIAKEADVNIAAVNYYFGTKDNLITTTLKSRLDHVADDIKQFVNQPNVTPRELINNLLNYLLDGMMNYPNFTKAYFHNAYQNNIYEEYFSNFINSITCGIYEIFLRNGSKIAEEELKLRVMQVIAAVVFHGMLPNLFENFSEKDPRSKEFRQEYINLLLNRFFD